MKTYKRSSGPYLLWASVFIVVPLIMVLYYAFTNGTGTFTLENFNRFFSGTSLGTLLRSVRIAAITTVICLAIGYPLAYFISRMKTSFRATAIMLVMIPMWMNFLLRTYAWVTILSKNGILNGILSKFGLGPFDMLYTEGAVILGMVYNFLPFMVLPIYTILEKMDKSLEEAAADLGANKRTVFSKVTLPLSMPGVMTGISMVFIPAISTFEVTALLGGNKTNLIGNVIEQQFTVTGDWNYGSSISVILMIFLVVSIVFSKDEDTGRDSAKKKKDRQRHALEAQGADAEEEVGHV